MTEHKGYAYAPLSEHVSEVCAAVLWFCVYIPGITAHLLLEILVCMFVCPSVRLITTVVAVSDSV